MTMVCIDDGGEVRTPPLPISLMGEIHVLQDTYAANSVALSNSGPSCHASLAGNRALRRTQQRWRRWAKSTSQMLRIY
jgi:hypothetical protein